MATAQPSDMEHGTVTLANGQQRRAYRAPNRPGRVCFEPYPLTTKTGRYRVWTDAAAGTAATFQADR